MSGILNQILEFAKSDKAQRLGAGLGGLSAGLLQAGAPRVGSPGPNAWGAGLQGFSSGIKADEQERRALEMQALKKQMAQAQVDEANRLAKMQRAREAYGTMQGGNTRPDGSGSSRLDMLRAAYPDQYAKAEIEQMMPSSSDMPMSIKEWIQYQKMTSDEKEQFLRMKRAQKVIDLGGSFAVPNMTDPTQVTPIAEKTLKPGEEPAVRGAQAEATAAGAAVGKEQGEISAKLSAAMATYPKLQSVVQKLSDLGKVASYTWTDRLTDEAKIQMGGKATKGAIARGEYIATVKNNVLPLLRQTFGAAFTAQEGESLLATLGDPNMHPSVKDAVLKSFIEQKAQEIDAMKRQVGGGDNSTDLKSKYGLE